MDTLTFSPSAPFAPEQGRQRGSPACRKRKLLEEAEDQLICKRQHLQTGTGTSTPPFAMQLFPPTAEPSQSYTSEMHACPGFPSHPAPFDHQVLQERLARELQHLLPYQPVQQGLNVYDFQEVQQKLLACGDMNAMQVDEVQPVQMSPQMPRSPSHTLSIPQSPPNEYSHISGSVALFTPVPSPQRSPGANSGGNHMGGLASMSPGSQRKMMLTMGYRKDCDKCRRGVPGHYMHVMER